MERREINRIKYFIVFVITSLVFLIGIWAGQMIAGYKFKDLEEAQMELRTQTATLETQYLLIAQNPCILLDSDKLEHELYEMGKKLSYMEETYSKGNSELNMLKEYYSLLELRHWLFLEQMKDKCETKDFVTILYFYSNLGDCEKCGEQGYVLTFLREKFPDLKIYSFDVNIENPALDWIKDSYAVKETPTLIIDGVKYGGFMDSEELTKLLK